MWGGEIILATESGILINERTADAAANGVHRLMENYLDRAATRRHVEQFSWATTTEQHLALYEKLLHDGRQRTLVLPLLWIRNNFRGIGLSFAHL